MRVLACSDFHGDWSTGGVERYDEVCRAMNQVHAYATTRGVGAVVFCGDLCNPDRDVPLAHRFIAHTVGWALSLRAAGIHFVAIPGNHDVIEDGRGSHTLMALERAGLLVAAAPKVFGPWEGALFAMLPYPSRVRRYDPAAFLRSIHPSPGASRILVAGHMTRVRGVPLGSETSDMPRGGDVEFPVDELATLERGFSKVVAVNGHFHRRHVAGRVLVPGSLVRLTHGEEENDPGFLVVEV